MRTFIAIELPEETKSRLANIQEKLQAAGADVKWVQPHNIHLTLKFLGEIDDKKLEKIKGALEDTAAEKKAFFVRLASLGAFPSFNSPRVIWVGLDKGDNEVREIAVSLEEKIARVGIPKEKRPFSSHITIGRTRSAQHRQSLVQYLNNTAEEFGKENLEFRAEKITLFKSTLTPKGPIYEILKEASLRAI